MSVTGRTGDQRGKTVKRDVVLEAIRTEGSQAAAARKLGVTRQYVNQIVNSGRGTGRSGRPKGSRNPLRPRAVKTGKPGLHSRGQQLLQKALAAPGAKSALARDLNWHRDIPGRYCRGEMPLPSLWTAVQFEKRFGIRCADWFEPPVL